MVEVPKKISEAICERVERDLEPSIKVIYAKVGTSMMVGGVLSLFICGQFGIGATPIAMRINENMHAMNGGIMCAIYCGAIFALIPLAILRFQCSPLQFNVIVKQNYHAVAVWLGGFGSMLVYHGNMGVEAVAFVAWFSAGALVFKLGSLLVPLLDRFFDKPFAGH